MAKVIYILLSLIVFTCFSCSTSPDFDDVPEIEFVSINKTIFNQNYQQGTSDTIFITLGVTDGNGDLGSEENANDIEFTDSRTGFITNNSLPMLPLQGSGNGIEGDIVMRLVIAPGSDFCCIPPSGSGCRPDPSFPQDTFSYLIRIRDRAGNWSNQVSTSSLTINCN